MGRNESRLSISIEGVRHVYKGGVVALDGIDLTVEAGVFGLLGPNGAGKSTLMRIICTLLSPTGGKVTVGGYDVVKDRELARSLLGYLSQEFSAWRLLRVGESLDILATLSGMNDDKIRKRKVREALESVGLEEVVDRKVKKLSGGMVRRLGVAQALVHDPRILVVDEPTVGLDPEERIHFRRLMTELGRDRIILLSTHIVADLGSGCSDLALMDNGRVAFRGSPSELVGRAKDSVFEIKIPPGREEAEMPAGFEIVSREENSEGITIRAVSGSDNPPSGAKRVENPNLEEAYLVFMVSQGRAGNSIEAGEEVTA